MDRRFFPWSGVRGSVSLLTLACAGWVGAQTQNATQASATSTAQAAAQTTSSSQIQATAQAGGSTQATTQAQGRVQATPGATIQSRATLVSLDVVVTDASGHAVHGLKPADFAISEDGQKMAPRSFEEHSASESTATAPGPEVQLPPNMFTNFSGVRGNGPLNVLLLDLLNTPPQDQAVVRQQMMDYLKNIPAGTRMAVFGLNTQLTMLQGFTSNPAVLKAALEQNKGVRQSPLLRTAQDADSENDQLEMMNPGGDATQSEITHDVAVFQAESATAQMGIQVQDTLAALDVLARYLAGMPGRKNLIWFSGSFASVLPNLIPQDVAPSIMLKERFGAALVTDFTGEVRQTSDLLARAQVAVYPIDARGVFTNPALKADTSGSSLTNPFSNGAPARANDPTAVPKAFIKSNDDFEKQTEEEHGSMDAVADQTGGRAQYGTNGLKEAVAAAIEDGQNYYTMTYAPVNHDWNGTFRTIKVTTDRPGAKLEYRHGYFALAAAKGGGNLRIGAPTTMQQAMIHGAPSPTQIVFRVKVDEAAGADSALPKGDLANEKKMKPPYRHYTVWYAADVRNVAFTISPDGIYHGEVEYEAKLVDADGGAVNTIADVVHANVPADKYMALLKQGLYVKQEIDAPAKGEYYLRIGMHDPVSDHVGAVEIPLGLVKVETAAAAAAATAAAN